MMRAREKEKESREWIIFALANWAFIYLFSIEDVSELEKKSIRSCVCWVLSISKGTTIRCVHTHTWFISNYMCLNKMFSHQTFFLSSLTHFFNTYKEYCVRLSVKKGITKAVVLLFSPSKLTEIIISAKNNSVCSMSEKIS